MRCSRVNPPHAWIGPSTQPALFTLQASLVELWRTWGIEPDTVLGHSVGEAAAAWTAGIFDLDGILRVVLARSRWQATTHGRGRMLAAGIGVDEARAWERKFPDRVSLAAINAPRQVTLAGDAAALEAIAAALAGAHLFHRFLAAPYAFHSAQMDAIADGLRRDLDGIAGHESQRPMASTVTGELVRGPEMDADYWWRNVREPVRFADGVARLLGDGCTALIEIGPHPGNGGRAGGDRAEREIVGGHRGFAATRRRRGAVVRQGLAELYRHGAVVCWERLYRRPTRAIRLPAYPWQRQQLWQEDSSTAREFRATPSHPLLGDRQPHPQPTWSSQLDARLTPWLADHRIAGSAVVPAAAYLEMAAAAVRELLGEPTIFLEDIRFHRVLFLPDERPVPACVRLDPSASSFQVLSARPDAPAQWDVQAEGLYDPDACTSRRPSILPPSASTVTRRAIRSRCTASSPGSARCTGRRSRTSCRCSGMAWNPCSHGSTRRAVAAGPITSCSRLRSIAAFIRALPSDACRIAARWSSPR